jgi:hypothetical protein
MTKRSWKILIFKAQIFKAWVGLLGAAGHSPNRAALATRKTCQNDEFPDSLAPLTTLWASHISPRRSNGYRAILPALLAVEPRIAELPLMMRKLPESGPRFGASR